MALITFPDDVLITREEVQPVNRSQIAHQVVNANTVQIFEYGFGSWIGTSVIGPQKDAGPIEAFFSDLNGATNTVELPFLRSTITGDATVSSIGTDGSYTLSGELEGAAVGAYVRAGTRMFIITEILADNPARLRLWPYYPLAAGDTIQAASSVLARQRGGPGPLTLTRISYGPWNFHWQEAP